MSKIREEEWVWSGCKERGMSLNRFNWLRDNYFCWGGQIPCDICNICLCYFCHPNGPCGINYEY